MVKNWKAKKLYMKKTNEIEKDWNTLDYIIAKIRYFQIDKYVPKDGTALDIGCGREGAFLYRHKKRLKVGIGVDYRQNNHIDENLKFICNKGMKKIPIDDESCDVVFMVAVLEHLLEPNQVIADCYRMLKHGGHIVITTPTPLSKGLLEYMAFKIHVISEEEIAEHVHYWSGAEIERLLKQYGFKIIKYKRFWFGMNSMCIGMK